MDNFRHLIDLIDTNSSNTLTESQTQLVHEWIVDFLHDHITKEELLIKIDESGLDREQVKEAFWAPFTALAGAGIGAAAVAADKGLNPLKWSKGDWASIGTDAALGATGAGLAGVAGRALAKTGAKKGGQWLAKKLTGTNATKAAANVTNKQIAKNAAKTGGKWGATTAAIDSGINLMGAGSA
jgi:hypothetical protein